MDVSFIRHRITELRLKKGISEKKMSYELGRGKGYIQSIASGKSRPKIDSLLEIIDYFDITPAEFFDVGLKEPLLINELKEKAKDLTDDEVRLVIAIVDKFNSK